MKSTRSSFCYFTLSAFMAAFLAIHVFVPAGHAEIVDNTDADFSFDGNWGVSTTVDGYYGSDYSYATAGDGSASAAWSFVINTQGQYAIYAQWTSDPKYRASNAPYKVYLDGTELDTVYADQRVNGGQFNLLGSYALAPGVLEIVLTNDADHYVIADAVKVVESDAITIIDNNDSGFNADSGWGTSSYKAGYFGSDYRFAPSGNGSLSASWSFAINAEAQYAIYAQWTSDPLYRASNAPYKVYLDGTELDTVYMDQRVNGGQFNLLGSYTLAPGILEIVLTNDADQYVIADAVKLVESGPPANMAPNGIINDPDTDRTITVGDSLLFSGTGSDLDGDFPLDFQWDFGDPAILDSNLENPGYVQFDNPGAYQVTFRVTDAEGLADPTPAVVNVTVLAADESIVDNTDAGFSVSGNWGTSTNVDGYYGSNYSYAAASDGSASATWSFVIGTAAQYAIYAQWTSDPKYRASNAPYKIYIDGTELDTIYKDQRVNGRRQVRWSISWLPGSRTWRRAERKLIRLRDATDEDE